MKELVHDIGVRFDWQPTWSVTHFESGRVKSLIAITLTRLLHFGNSDVKKGNNSGIGELRSKVHENDSLVVNAFFANVCNRQTLPV